jgi:hypothetical protein
VGHVLIGFGNTGRKTGASDRIAKSGVGNKCNSAPAYLMQSIFPECSMPTLSGLLENPRISETDSFIICVQIHSPAGPQFPQHPSAYYVPRDLLDGVEASLDNPRKSRTKHVSVRSHLTCCYQIQVLRSASLNETAHANCD